MPPPAEPIRFRVSFRSAAALLAELTRSIHRGTVSLPSPRPLPPGTRFLFELHASGVTTPAEVLGEVVQVTPRAEGGFLLAIRYFPGQSRAGVDAALERLLDAHRFEQLRRHPRIPLHLRAQEERTGAPRYLVRDLSRSGMGVEVETGALPAYVRTGQPFLLEVGLEGGLLALHGEVVWTWSPAPPGTRPAKLGARFGRLRPEVQARLDEVLALRALPPPPPRARLSFGMDAVARMP
jgi:hypothetical protein